MKVVRENNGRHNKSMDVRAKQRLCYHAALLPLACVNSVSPHVNAAVRRLRCYRNERLA